MRKYGTIAARSIKFKKDLKNFHLFAEERNRSAYSNVNQVIAMISIISMDFLKSDFSWGVPVGAVVLLC